MDTTETTEWSTRDLHLDKLSEGDIITFHGSDGEYQLRVKWSTRNGPFGWLTKANGDELSELKPSSGVKLLGRLGLAEFDEDNDCGDVYAYVSARVASTLLFLGLNPNSTPVPLTLNCKRFRYEREPDLRALTTVDLGAHNHYRPHSG